MACGPDNARRNKTLSPLLSAQADIQSTGPLEGAGSSYREKLMGFTKLDEGILQSSIMAEDSDTFKIWIALMASCEADGIARISPAYLANVCHIPIEIVTRAFDKFLGPDPQSRNSKREGRRIERVKHGWKLLNYQHYRRFLYSDSPDAIRQRRHREKICDKRDVSQKGVTSLLLPHISFIFSSLKWEGITEDDLIRWKEAYPVCDIKIELARMREWIISNRQKGKKSNWRRFITNWLSRVQDRGGTKDGTPKRTDEEWKEFSELIKKKETLK